MGIRVTDRSKEQTRARYPDEAAYVERDGIKIFYEVYGVGEPTVLLMPTWEIVHSRSWKFQIPYLARHCRVVTFDPRGNGRSDRAGDYEAYRRTRVRRRCPGRARRSWDRPRDRGVLVRHGRVADLGRRAPRTCCTLGLHRPAVVGERTARWCLAIRCRARHGRGLGQGDP